MDNLTFTTLLQIQLAILVAALVAIIVHQYAKQHSEEFGLVSKISNYFLIGLGAFALLIYVNFEPLSPRPNYWDAFHYYIGSKYFPEIRYDRFYACVAKAESESEDPSIRFAAQTRHITDLTSKNRVVPASLYLDDAYCKARFSTERWNNFKSDVSFFHSKMASNKAWAAIQLDRGYNGSPVWALAGGAISNMLPLSDTTLKNIALIDVLFLFGCAVCLAWAFGLPTASFAVIVSTVSDIANWS
ncbi:MAG: hypothetical protein WCE58_01035 [Gallionella sp.]